jgi:hypothetical protein
MARVDLTTDNGETYKRRITRKCGCTCEKCGWEGIRVIHFVLDLAFDLSRIGVLTDAIKGKISAYRCPRPDCDGSVLFTHVPQPNRRTR